MAERCWCEECRAAALSKHPPGCDCRHHRIGLSGGPRPAQLLGDYLERNKALAAAFRHEADIVRLERVLREKLAEQRRLSVEAREPEPRGRAVALGEDL